MAGLWNLFKVWNDDETLTTEDLNDSFETVQENSIASQIEGTSTLNNVPNDSLMDAMQAPFPNSVRNYAASIADEIQELRYMIAQILGLPEWYDPPTTNLNTVSTELTALLNQSVGGAVPPNRIISGFVDTNRQPNFLLAVSGQPQVKVLGTSTALSYFIGGSPYSLTADKISGSLVLAPSSANTATTGSTLTTAQANIIPLVSPGANIVANSGKICAFQIGAEILVGRVTPASGGNYVLTSVYRSYLFDTTGVVIPSIAHVSGSVITLLQMNWVFIDNNQNILTTKDNPVFSSIAPSAPNTGDFWYDFVTSQWMVYGSSSFGVANVNLLGYAVTNTTTAVATRSFDAYRNYAATNTLQITVLDNSDLTSAGLSDEAQIVNSYGGTFRVQPGIGFTWSVPANLDTGSALAANSTYYLYIDDQGKPWISLVDPVNRSSELFGWYHPNKPWRNVGLFFTDASVNVFTPSFYNTAISTVVSPNTTSTSPVAATGLTAQLACSGGPVFVQILPQNNPGGGTLETIGASGAFGYVQIVRSNAFQGSQLIYTSTFGMGINGAALHNPSSINFMDETAGTQLNTYQIYFFVQGAGQTFNIINCYLQLSEMKHGDVYPRNLR
jgi:hypothetical protein